MFDVAAVLSAVAAVVPDRHESVPLSNIVLHPRARSHDGEMLAELTASIKDRRQLQPGRGRMKEGHVELYVGAGRFQSLQALGEPNMDVIISERSDEHVDLDMLHENLKREDLDPITEAQEYKHLIEAYQWSQVVVAEKVGKSPSRITEALALLTLGDDVKEKLRRRNISQTHGLIIAKLTDQGKQSAVAAQVIAHHLTTDQTEKLVSTLGRESAVARPKAAVKDLSRFWPGLPDGVLAKFETGWVTLRWSPRKYEDLKALLRQLLDHSPDRLDLPKSKKEKKAKRREARGTPPGISDDRQPDNAEAENQGGSDSPAPSVTVSPAPIVPTRRQVPIPQIQEASYVEGNRLQLRWGVVGENFAYRLFRSFGDLASPSFQVLADGKTVSTPGAIINIYAGGGEATLIAVMAIDPEGHESELSQPIKFELKSWNQENSLEPLPSK